MKLPAWARGPYELIEHAERHYLGNSDTDRRIALISFDNAIEVVISTFLQLNPKLRGGIVLQRDDVQRWLQNYHSKIEFFEHFAIMGGISLQLSIAEIIWYHTLRNELYHSGNGMIPERHVLNGVRDAALEVYKVLFGIDVSQLLHSKVTVAPLEGSKYKLVTTDIRFLEAYIAFERALRAFALTVDKETSSYTQGIVELWKLLKGQVGQDASKYDPVIDRARLIRNKLTYTGVATESESELEFLISQLEEVVEFLQAYPLSVNILPELENRYSDWVRPEITILRIVQRNKTSFLEITCRASGIFDEEIKRVDLNFIVNGDEPVFSPTRRAQENANRFFDELDLYSIIMTGIGTILFTPAGVMQAVALSGADGTEKKGNITRRP